MNEGWVKEEGNKARNVGSDEGIIVSGCVGGGTGGTVALYAADLSQYRVEVEAPLMADAKN